MHKTFHFLKWSGKKAVAFLCASLALATVVVGTTFAVLKMMTETHAVEFQPATVSVNKSTDGKGVVNDGNVDVYVRVAMIFTWESTSEENSIMSSSPILGTNYSFAVAEGWTKAADGFWYYLSPISPSKVQSVISSVELIGNAPAGYDLSVELLIDAIQADPSNAVTESWESGVTSVSENGTLVLKSN